MNSNELKKKEYFVGLIIKRLEEAREKIIDQWENPIDTPTRHFVLDNFFPNQDVEKIYSAFPRNGEGFFDRESFREKNAHLQIYQTLILFCRILLMRCKIQE